MYTKDSVVRLVRKKGIIDALKILASPNFSDTAKKQLEKDFIFVGGFPNVDLISSFV